MKLYSWNTFSRKRDSIFGNTEVERVLLVLMCLTWTLERGWRLDQNEVFWSGYIWFQINLPQAMIFAHIQLIGILSGVIFAIWNIKRYFGVKLHVHCAEWGLVCGRGGGGGQIRPYCTLSAGARANCPLCVGGAGEQHVFTHRLTTRANAYKT